MNYIYIALNLLRKRLCNGWTLNLEIFIRMFGAYKIVTLLNKSCVHVPQKIMW